MLEDVLPKDLTAKNQPMSGMKRLGIIEVPEIGFLHGPTTPDQVLNRFLSLMMGN
jgi:hypothetical protein